MARIAAIAACAGVLAACAQPEPTAPPVDPFAETRVPECYTVDLFGENPVLPPGEAVPPEWRGFSGGWGGGAWAGVWCHDLYVLSVSADGAVEVIETHAPYEPWGKRATAFRRTGRIGEDGRLRFGYGQVRLEYWVEDGTLYGRRSEGPAELLIALEPLAAGDV